MALKVQRKGTFFPQESPKTCSNWLNLGAFIVILKPPWIVLNLLFAEGVFHVPHIVFK